MPTISPQLCIKLAVVINPCIGVVLVLHLEYQVKLGTTFGYFIPNSACMSPEIIYPSTPTATVCA